MLENVDLRDEFLTEEEWLELRTIRDFLASFSEATLRAEGNKGSIGQTLILLNVLSSITDDTLVIYMLLLFYLIKLILFEGRTRCQ